MGGALEAEVVEVVIVISITYVTEAVNVKCALFYSCHATYTTRCAC